MDKYFFALPCICFKLNGEVAVYALLKENGVEKVMPQVKKLTMQTGLVYQQLKFQKMEEGWGSCTESNTTILNTEAVKLPVH